jgi:enoyl-CoA hydratase/carnithine racemase
VPLPQALNTLDLATASELRRRLDIWSRNDIVGGVLLQGKGGHFCGGADLDWLAENRSRAPELFASLGLLYETITHYPKPLIALLNGDTSGSGIALSNTPFRVATATARFAVSEPSVGLVPDGPFCHMLAKCDSATNLPIAAYLSLTGVPVGADDMMRLGLATHQIDGTEVGALVRHLSSVMVGSSKLDVGEALDLICGWQSDQRHDAAAAGIVRAGGYTLASDEEDGLPFVSTASRAAITACFSGGVEEAWSQLEGMSDSEEGDWARTALSGMARCPALSLVATHRLVTECRDLSASGAAALSQRVATRLASGSCFGDVVDHTARGTTAAPTTLADIKAVRPDELAALFER